MKAKLFIFIGFIAAAIGMSLVFNTASVHAAGETYRWVNENTIEGSGGSFENLYADGKVTFNRNDGFAVSVENTCVNREPFVITITPSQSNRNGSLTTSGCGEEGFSSLDPEAYEFDIAFDIANPENGPPLPGSDIDFMELDCSTYVNRPDLGENFDQERWRCEAMQACIESGSSQPECLTTWVGCVDERSNSFSCRNDMVENGTNIDLDGEGEEDENATTCAVDGIGWIICPILNFTASLADGAYGIVASFLEVQPLLTTGTSEPIYQAWSIMRNIANVAFVIAFMIIIFSQITSFGISNYGIKRMLPRLIVAAILVNVSYWICAIAVDVTNILGSSIKDLFDGVGASFESPNFSGLQQGVGWSNITIGVLSAVAVGAAILYVTLSALIPILITVIAALLSTLIILAIRQALIILLVVISPLAFVAFLLPNTQNLFSSWRNLFQTLLLMFPIIAAIFGASALASQIVTASAQNIDNESLRIVTQIFGAGIASIPLLLTIIIPRLAGRMGSFINDPTKGFFDRSRKRAEQFRDRRQNIAEARRLERAAGGRWMGKLASKTGPEGSRRRRTAAWLAGSGRTSALNAAQKEISAEKAVEEAKRNYVADRAAGDIGYAQRIAGPTGDVNAVQAAALAAQKKAFAESVSDMEALVKVRFDDPAKALEEAIRKGDKIQAVAAQNLLFQAGGSGVSSFRRVVESSEANPDVRAGLENVSSELKRNVQDRHGQFAKQKGADIVKWAASAGQSLTDSKAGSKPGDLSDRDLAGQHHESLKKAIEQGLVSGAQAGRMLNDPRISADLDDIQKKLLQSIPGSDTRPTPSDKEIGKAQEQAIQEDVRRFPPSNP